MSSDSYLPLCVLFTGEGQEQVARAYKDMLAAAEYVNTTETALSEAQNAQIRLTPRPLSTLDETQCDWIRSDVAFVTAETTQKRCLTEVRNSRVAYTSNQSEYAEVLEEAAELKHDCECKTQNTLETEWQEAIANAAERKISWAQAHHIDCILQNIHPPDPCLFDPAPTVTKPQLCFEAVECTGDEEPSAADPEISYAKVLANYTRNSKQHNQNVEKQHTQNADNHRNAALAASLDATKSSPLYNKTALLPDGEFDVRDVGRIRRKTEDLNAAMQGNLSYRNVVGPKGYLNVMRLQFVVEDELTCLL